MGGSGVRRPARPADPGARLAWASVRSPHRARSTPHACRSPTRCKVGMCNRRVPSSSRGTCGGWCVRSVEPAAGRVPPALGLDAQEGRSCVCGSPRAGARCTLRRGRAHLWCLQRIKEERAADRAIALHRVGHANMVIPQLGGVTSAAGVAMKKVLPAACPEHRMGTSPRALQGGSLCVEAAWCA